jgi:nucleotide-binding universal stress UspA family protein
LAGRLESPVLIVHTHPYGALSGILGEGEYEELVRGVADSTFLQVKTLVGEGREREMRVISADSPAAGLQRVAEREEASLIVVGPSHRSGLGRVRPGSVGERLLSGAPAPVAIAPRGYADGAQRLGVVACAFDASPESQLALEWAARLARAGGSRLLVISVHTPLTFGAISAGGAFSIESVNQTLRRDLERDQRDAVASCGAEVEGVLRDGDAAEALEQASQDADILVMGSRGYGPLRAVLLGSVSQHVIRNAACPVVVCPRGANTADSEAPTA